MKDKLEKQIKKTKKTLDPDNDIFDACRQILALIEMFYIYLEEKFNNDTRKDP